MCRILGVGFIAIGLLVIVRGAAVDPYHNLLHVATGVVAAGIGFRGSRSAARNFCTAFGVGYIVLGGLGLLLGDPLMDRLWHAGPLHLNSGDHAFHLVLGGIMLGSGLLTRLPAVRSQAA